MPSNLSSACMNRSEAAMDKPIFVVGPSRSGTTMMCELLNGHRNVNIAPETHYFDDLRTLFEAPDTKVLAGAELRRVQDYFLAQTHRPFGHGGEAEKGWMNRSDLAALADKRGGTADAYFEAYVMMAADDEVVSIFGEKTPRHVFRIADIFKRYPDARIVGMLRDPRAVTVSYRDWRNQGGFDLEADPDHAEILEEEMHRARKSYHPVILAMLWRGQAGSMLKAAREFGPEQVYIQKYEDLVADPESQARKLCDWLGLDFGQNMLNVAMSNSSFSGVNNGQGVSKEAVERWKSHLDDTEIALIQSVAKSRMIEAGYELEPVSPSLAGRMASYGSFPLALGRSFAANKDRIGNPVSYIAQRLKNL